MKYTSTLLILCLSHQLTVLCMSQAVVKPQVRSKVSDGKVTVVEVAAHFVSAIRLPEPVNAIALGDPAMFQVEHSEQEPELVLVKALTERSAATNLIVSTIHGRQFTLLLVNRGSVATPNIDFLLQYKPVATVLVQPQIMPFPLVGETAPILKPESPPNTKAELAPRPSPRRAPLSKSDTGSINLSSKVIEEQTDLRSLDDLLLRQEDAPLPKLYGGRIAGEHVKGDRLRVGVSEVLDGGDQVTVLFSVLNTYKHAILLMPPQVQLGGKERTGKLVKHERWSTTEQLAVTDFRLSRRHLGRDERADGVVVFERPPYKQSNEQLFLQMAESGAVDRPALAPIGFGVSAIQQEEGDAK